MPNAIVIENEKPGTPQSVWDVTQTDQIEGFSTDISVDHGDTVSFKINLNVPTGHTAPYHIDIYRLGYYGGDGATLVTTINGLTGIAQPDPITNSLGEVDAGNWSVSASWATPANAVSGVYLADLVRDDSGATNEIPFIVRADDSTSDIVVQTSDTTWEAYNGWAGRNGQVGPSLYGGFAQPPNLSADPSPVDYNRAFAVSYNRPFIDEENGGTYAGPQDYVFGADYAGIYWLEENGYDASYISGVDTARLGAGNLEQHKAFISLGHDEYWSGDQRANVEAARDAGVNLLFWSGNEVYWKTELAPSIADGASDRTIVSYKESKFNASPTDGPNDYANVDPSNQWTGLWSDTRFVDAVGPDGVTHTAIGAKPTDALTGQQTIGDGTGEFGGAIDVPSADAALRYWRNTGIGPSGATNIAPGILGYEWDTSPDDASRPAGLIKLSDTALNWSALISDFGNAEAPGTADHTLTLYRAPSGALVFGAGTVFWTWGLSNEHESSPYGADIASTALQQFTVNLLADMGIQPGVTDATLVSEGLSRASASNDHIPGAATMNALASTTDVGSTVTVSGTATDVSGVSGNADGKIALVEVSTDGGETWRPAQGTQNWTYSWVPSAAGTYTVEARALDDSLNLPSGAAIASSQIVVTTPAGFIGDSVFGVAVTPTGQLFDDHQPVELGMKFQAATAGEITALRYFRAVSDADDTDVRQGHLWSSDGVLLGTVTFTSASGQSGWQVAALDTPVEIEAGQTYVVSYRTDDNYLASDNYFGSSVTNGAGDLTAPSSGAAGGNGLFAYGSGLQMPAQSFDASNYWADVVFSPSGGVSPPAQLALDDSSDSGALGDGTTDHPALVIDGTAAAGATVTVYDGVSAVGSGLANGAGAFQVTTSDLQDGAHSLTATATLGASTSPASAPIAVTVDTQAPASPANLADAAISNGQVVSGDTPDQAVTGTAEAGALVTVYDNETELGAVTASGSGQWSYTVGVLTDGAHSVTATATDVAGNTGPASTPLAFTVAAQVVAGDSFFRPAAPPNGQEFDDHQPVELGMKFQATTAGEITALSYWRDPGDANDTDTRQGHLWGPDGTVLGTVTFASPPGASGWQVATLSTPVEVQPGETYAVSYRTSDNYLASGGYFTNAVTDASGDLTAPIDAGVYVYGAALQEPAQSFQSANYWVDVVFTPSGGGSVAAPTGLSLDPSRDSGLVDDNLTNQAALLIDGTATAGASVTLYDGSAAVGAALADASGAFQVATSILTDGAHVLTATATAGGVTSAASTPITLAVDTQPPAAPAGLGDAAIVGGYVSAANDSAAQALTGTAESGAVVTVYDDGGQLGVTTASASGQWSYTLGVLANGAHSLTAAATDPADNQGPASGALDFTVQPAREGVSVFDAVTPSGQDFDDHQTVELGMKFEATAAGEITALRYWRDPGDANDTDTRQGHLWAPDGTLLATVTFTSPPGANGWQVASLSTPVDVQVGATYVVSYKTDADYLAADNYFTSAVTDASGDLMAPAGAGVYAYGSALQEPTQVYESANYWVDVVFTPAGGASTAASATLTGTAGADVLLGGPGDDRLLGAAGDDTEAGGEGADVFAFAPGFGADLVSDFTSGSDQLEFSRALFAAGLSDGDIVSQILGGATSSGGATVLHLDASSEVTLQGIAPASLGAPDFLFV